MGDANSRRVPAVPADANAEEVVSITSVVGNASATGQNVKHNPTSRRATRILLRGGEGNGRACTKTQSFLTENFLIFATC